MDIGKGIVEEYIQEGKIKAELDELCSKVLREHFYAGISINFNETVRKILITVLNPNEVIGENKFFLKQFHNMICQRYGWNPNSLSIIFEKIVDRRLEPAYYAELLRQLFMSMKPYKKVINQAFRNVKAAGGQGVRIKIAGKVKGQRAKSTKYTNGLIIQAGTPAQDYIKTAKSEAKCPQGVIGIQVSIMLPYDPEGVKGPSVPLPDKISIFDSKALN